ncbi:MAG: site-specific integrase [Campylobacteraceae bacterium]|jgi:site-specific recombinase XerD|nr:site-specific integrase [Campylobacteraceae bacterium]
MSGYIKSSTKYDGIYHKNLINGDKSFYITYKDGNKKKWVKIGKESENINIAYCHLQRNVFINKAKFGDISPLAKYKQKDGVTFKDAVCQYIEHKELVKKVASQYRAIENIFGNSQLDEITVDTINKLKNTLTANGKAPRTVITYLQRISAVFNFAIDRELFKGLNPCKKVDKPKGDSKRDRYLSVNEIRQLKEAVKDHPMRLLFVELSLSTGARFNTIMEIQKKDINLNAKSINLRNFKAKNDYTGFISDSLYSLLVKRLKELSTPNDKVVGVHYHTIERPIQTTLNRLFNQGLNNKDTKNRVVIHTLRHTFASHLAINGIPIFTIMKLLDHKDIKDTLRYAKLASDNGLDAVRGLRL